MPATAVIAGMNAALAVGSLDPAVVAIEARRAAQDATAGGGAYRGGLARFDRPIPTLDRYDDLLEAR